MGDFNQDPSMEEILASIKRVIAEDGRAATTSTRGPRGYVRAEPEPEPEPPLEEDDVLELSDPVSEEDALMSQERAAASRQSLAALSAVRQQSAAESGALEAVVRDMLRPILKDWLDEHLPQIVEELVTREITRITGRGL